jgi:hypothetical protein
MSKEKLKKEENMEDKEILQFYNFKEKQKS